MPIMAYFDEKGRVLHVTLSHFICKNELVDHDGVILSDTWTGLYSEAASLLSSDVLSSYFSDECSIFCFLFLDLSPCFPLYPVSLFNFSLPQLHLRNFIF